MTFTVWENVWRSCSALVSQYFLLWTFASLIQVLHSADLAVELGADFLPPVDVFANKSLTTTDSIVLEWFKPFDTRVQGYQILYQRYTAGVITPPPMPNIINIFNASLTSFTVTGLDSGTQYSFRMKSFVEDVVSVESPASVYCTRPPRPRWSVQPLPVKLMLQIQRSSNATKYYRVRVLNLDVKDAPVQEITFRNDSLVVNHYIAIAYLGATYEILVAAAACDVLSEEGSQIVHSMPPTIIYTHPPVEVTQTSVKFLFQAGWKSKRSMLTRFVFAAEGIPSKYVLPSDEDVHVVELTGLIPGRNYKILGWSERGDVQSDKRYLMVQLKPNNVTALTATNITSRSIRITWEPPFGDVGKYEVGRNDDLPISTNATSWTFSDLLPSTVYTVFVKACSDIYGRECSASLTRFVTTSDDKRQINSTVEYKVLTLSPKRNNGRSPNYVLSSAQSVTLLFANAVVIISMFLCN